MGAVIPRHALSGSAFGAAIDLCRLAAIRTSIAGRSV
jgi:hypothetical protein